jgi:hypothetical protein
MMMVLAVCITTELLGGQPTADAKGVRSEKNDLVLIEEFYRLNGVRLTTNDLIRFEETYRSSGGSDGVFNVPEGISRADEWDVNIYRVAKREGNGDFVPLSKAEITRNRISASPYSRGGSGRWATTLGQVVKQCDGVFIGEIIKAHYSTTGDEENVKSDYAVNVGLTFRVETNLFGRLPPTASIAPLRWEEGGKHAPHAGMKLMVFYARGCRVRNFDREPFGFDWEKPPADPAATPAVPLDKSASIRILETPELEKSYIEAVDGYLRLLRREKRDPDKYYKFLTPLARSPVWRIRQDAREDLLRLLSYNGPDRFDLNQVLDDPEQMGIFKDYVRYVAFSERERRKAEQKKE